jgi:hypothetical protein
VKAMPFYAYKGLIITKNKQGIFIVEMPDAKRTQVFATRSLIDAKDWIEKIESKNDLIKAAAKFRKVTGR